MFEIDIKFENNNYIIKDKMLTTLSILFIEELEKIAKKNENYKKIIIENKINSFNYTMTEKAKTSRKITAKSDYINYEYQKNKSANDHFTQINLQLESLKNGFENKNLQFEYFLTPKTWSSIPRDNKTEINNKNSIKKEKRNLLYFGAPGTGKSFEVEELTKNEKTFRTMFHEEYSYFDFIGQYKPTVSEKSSQGSYKNARNVVITGKEPVILYDYVAGDFIKAYVEAKLNPNTKIYFIIEEINRGNCAAIFGDIFQLLDRNANDSSKYPTTTPVELENYLKSFEIGDSNILSIPENLFIVGTMNTSDQSLYPMDSAFKRRWDMKFISINYKEEKLKQTIIEGTEIKWLDFLLSINELIGEKLESENKMLGQWFIKEENNVIFEEDFKNKILNYLYYDVFKHDRKAVFGEIQYSKIFNKDINIILSTLMRKNED
jgi:5-methylcytosine-specific restriction endonuclease McrBC GTP-binding regulatory subunit McrB